MVRIKFKTEADEARGFYELLTRASGESLQGGVYWVEESALKILDESGIGYEILVPAQLQVGSFLSFMSFRRNPFEIQDNHRKQKKIPPE